MAMNEQLQSLIADILDIPVGEVVPDLMRADTEQWDSLNHLRLMTAFEEEFGIRLTMQEIADIQSPRQLQAFIDERGSTGP
jgi:acyl carrier protein